MPVHVVFGLADVHHLVRVELEHALHLGVLGAIGGPLGVPPLLQKLPSTLALAYSPQVPEGHNREEGHRYTTRESQREKKNETKGKPTLPTIPTSLFLISAGLQGKFTQISRNVSAESVGVHSQYTHNVQLDLTGIT